MKTYQIERKDLATHPTLVLRATVSVAEIGPFVGRAFAAVAQALGQEGLSPAGPPFARYHRLAEDRFEVEAGFPTARAVSTAGEVSASSLPGGPVAVMTYIGPYDQMEAAYAALLGWVTDHGGEPSGDSWEVYLSDPAVEPDAGKWRTEIVMPFTS